jgi:hypothetical protein
MRNEQRDAGGQLTAFKEESITTREAQSSSRAGAMPEALGPRKEGQFCAWSSGRKARAALKKSRHFNFLDFSVSTKNSLVEQCLGNHLSITKPTQPLSADHQQPLERESAKQLDDRRPALPRTGGAEPHQGRAFKHE